MDDKNVYLQYLFLVSYPYFHGFKVLYPKSLLVHCVNDNDISILFRYHGYISAALVLGGVDSTGPHLYSVYPHGSTDKLPFVTMGR